ncbi:hypothetical protein DRQ15_06080 [candidate division KSB1 bacterium]|nr:MAG: hypothetical protein DRQ15_06080 [candidate division KSB1 bacterium]
MKNKKLIEEVNLLFLFFFALSGQIWAQTVYVPNRTHIWPVDSPLIYTGDSSQEHGISGTLGEFRTQGGNHFHGGVDILEPTYTDVFSVFGDGEYVVEATGPRMGIREWYEASGTNWEEWGDGDGDQWFTHRYKHIDRVDEIQERDEIVNNTSLTGRTEDPDHPGWYLYPRHLLIGEIDAANHLHFEEVCYDGISGNDATDGYFNFNPLFLLSPFEDDDDHDSVIEKKCYYILKGATFRLQMEVVLKTTLTGCCRRNFS